MQIVGFNLNKISVEKKGEFKGKVEIKSNINVEEIKKTDINLTKEKEVLSFDFVFDILYEPKIAEVSFKGNVLILLEPEQIKEVLKNWKKKKIDESVRLGLFNTILLKCNIRALQLEEELNLPPHIPLPHLTKQQETQYTG